MSDHLARLCMDGIGSTGRYTPYAFDLRLLGTEQAADHIVYLHEVHHAALNDMTAWGSALHVYARLPATSRPRFARLLDVCRTVHESLATFASVQIATARHGALDLVLARYPRYVPLYQATERLTAGVEGANRRQQVATALARLCMQTPVLDAILATGFEEFRLAAIRECDRPDARWSWFLRRGPGLVATASQAADRVVLDEYGPAVLESDASGNDLYTSTDRSHDEAWDRWEAVAYEHLRAELAASGAGTLALNGHQDGTARLVALVEETYGDVGLRAAMTEDQRRDDAEVAASVLQQVRHDLAGGVRHRAILLPPTSTDDLVLLLGDRPVIGGRPAMIVDARPAARLATLFRWPGGGLPDALSGPDTAVVAVRLVVADDDGTAIGHALLPEPAGLAALTRSWGDRGAFVFCVGASCLADPEFARRWLPDATSERPVFVLVDVEPARFVPRWRATGRTVVAVPLTVQDTSGQRTALLFTADDGRFWWLVVADDITVRLTIEYLRGQLGASFRIEPDVFATIREPALVAVTHVLATESFTSFDALGAGHAD